ncbi:MAG: MoaD/ThiS family protein [Candidatus Rokubacteria bacterium]|nr:MoaD/ThiS family protein [Candidatus Rokubacteria bacterium]
MSVRLLGLLPRFAGARDTHVEVEDGATVLDVLTALAARHGAPLASAIFRSPRDVHTHLRVFLDEEEAPVSSPVIRPGAGAATVAVLPMQGFEGGSR